MLTNSVLREELYNVLMKDRPDFEGKKIFIWGTGNTALLYQQGLKRLEKEGLTINGYCDNHMEKFAYSKIFCSKIVLGVEELKQEKDVYVLICTPQPQAVNAISSQLDQLGIRNIHIDAAVFKLHAAELMKCYDALEDAESKDIYARLIMCRMNGLYPKDLSVNRMQYFALDPFWNHNADEVFVDCGAFVGDMVERYIWNKGGVFGKIIAFEPDRNNYVALSYRVERLKKEWNLKNESIELIPAGVGESTEGGYLLCDVINGGLGSKFVDDASKGVMSCIYSIDAYITEPFDFLKADIEGYEYQMLLGAKESIKKNKPLLAVCIYHNAVDFYSILLLIQSIEPKYKFAVRHHTSRLSETVLYAWVEERNEKN